MRTTHHIQSAFATVPVRANVTDGGGLAAAALAMGFELVESVRQRWRAVDGPHLAELPEAVAA
ncbi:hypothetical protein [Streptomyces coeruleorubidus]|uniref:hypothetical protein n=1 Tax=Streptomyces coeruleorubidus TaxID=116188 RepID=UPI0033B43A58